MTTNRSEKPLVRIVDDNDSLRESLAFLLECEGYEVAAYESAEEFLIKDAPSRIGCIVLDVRMPKMSGLQLQERLNELGTPCPIVFLTGHGDIDMAVQSMKDGACDFLQKPIKQETFIPAIERAINKDRQARAGATDIIHERHVLASLTPREEDVCRLVAEGLTSVLIASRLNISKRTVDVIRSAALKKIGLREPHELADFFKRVTEKGRPSY